MAVLKTQKLSVRLNRASYVLRCSKYILHLKKCSPEQSKLCFEALETHSVPQNYLPLQVILTPSEVGRITILEPIKLNFTFRPARPFFV